MNITHEIALNRCNIESEDGADKQLLFCVPSEWVSAYVSEHFTFGGEHEYKNLDDFLNAYTPEIEGEKMYQAAVDAEVVTEEFFDYTDCATAVDYGVLLDAAEIMQLPRYISKKILRDIKESPDVEIVKDIGHSPTGDIYIVWFTDDTNKFFTIR